MKTTGFFGAAAIVATCALSSNPALAARAETASPSQLRILQASFGDENALATPTCPLTMQNQIVAEDKATKEFLGTILATAFAGIVGEVAKAGVNAIGDALEQASQERGFVAQADASFQAGRIRKFELPINPSDDLTRFDPFTLTRAAYEETPRCLVLFVPGPKPKTRRGETAPKGVSVFEQPDGPIAKERSYIQGSAQLRELDTLAPDDDKVITLINELDEIKQRLENLGIKTPPKLYIEALLMPYEEGLKIRPLLVWYREALNGAPTSSKSKKSAELHVTLATPSYDKADPTSIGAGFAGARIKLPKLAPGSLLGPDDLASSTSLWLPLRPKAGAVKDTLDRFNANIATLRTKEAERRKTLNAFNAARNAEENDAKPAKLQVAAENLLEAERSLAIARKIEKDADVSGKAIGATNAKVRFVLIKEANKFGLAIAKALKGQAETVGKEATKALTPSEPATDAQNTAYLAAILDVAAKDRALSTAMQGTDSNAIFAAQDALTLAKDAANTAAKAIGKPEPYPGLLDGI